MVGWLQCVAWLTVFISDGMGRFSRCWHWSAVSSLGYLQKWKLSDCRINQHSLTASFTFPGQHQLRLATCPVRSHLTPCLGKVVQYLRQHQKQKWLSQVISNHLISCSSQIFSPSLPNLDLLSQHLALLQVCTLVRCRIKKMSPKVLTHDSHPSIKLNCPEIILLDNDLDGVASVLPICPGDCSVVELLLQMKSQWELLFLDSSANFMKCWFCQMETCGPMLGSNQNWIDTLRPCAMHM